MSEKGAATLVLIQVTLAIYVIIVKYSSYELCASAYWSPYHAYSDFVRK